MPGEQVSQETLKPLKITCTSTDCANGLHCFRRTRTQEQDLSEPSNCDGFGRIRHFRRATERGLAPKPLAARLGVQNTRPASDGHPQGAGLPECRLQLAMLVLFRAV